MKLCPTIPVAMAYARDYLANTGQIVKAKKWQGTQAPSPMFEALDLSFKVPMPQTIDKLIDVLVPSTPWAETHFQERIGGIPLNPPPSHEYWPFGKDNNKGFTGEDAKFDHTYPERFWPKFAGDKLTPEFWGLTEDKTRSIFLSEQKPLTGIRFEYGDLKDVIKQLIDDPCTRQAYLPIFFPEDTGAKGGKGRVPCTLGYHFIIRSGFVHITYLMRSCDYLRHFKDDIYLAIRLAQYVTDELNNVKDQQNPMGFDPLRLGMLKFYTTSFHVFEFEQNKI